MQQDRLFRMGLAGLGLGHELNGPLTSAALALELLAERLEGPAAPSPTETAAEVRRVLAAVQRMGTLVGHLRALARDERCGVGPVSLDAVIDSALRLTRPTLAALGALTLERGPRTEPIVSVDALLLEQAVICLILNAAEAAGDGGRVRIYTQGSGLIVEDDGPGFAGELEPGDSTKSEGMGVGLALTRLITTDAGGTLRVENLTEGGARVRMEFDDR